MIPQPKTVMTHNHLQELFSAKYPDGSLLLSSDVGGAKRRYSVAFGKDGKRYDYAGTAKDVAAKLSLLPQYAIVKAGIAGNVIEHWNVEELEQIAEYCNGEVFQSEEKATAKAWGVQYVKHQYLVVKM
jgi:hypothetical protein